MSLIQRAEQYFEFEALGTTWRTEVVAGLTTFLTMSYIVFVNPAILREAGMPVTGVGAATCVAAALGSLMMGLVARYPIGLAPSMGINAYFTYTVVLGMGIPWQTALGAVFVSGIIFLVLTVAGLQQAIVRSIPDGLHAAVGAGIGLFLALIGMQNAGIVVANEVTMVVLGDLTRPSTAVALFGLMLISALIACRVKSSMVLGIVGTTIVAIPLGLVRWNPTMYTWSGLASTAFALDIDAAISLGLLEIVFVFWFVDLFDNVGTLVAVGKKAQLFENGTRIPRLGRIFVTDGAASTVGSALGTSSVVNCIESAAGVVAGGRSGVTAVVVGLLFLLSLPLAPLFGVIPRTAASPALMLSAVREIDWNDASIAIPAFLTLTTIPLSYSIASGLAIGFISYTVLKLLRGEYRRIGWLTYILAGLFVLRFVYLGSAG